VSNSSKFKRLTLLKIGKDPSLNNLKIISYGVDFHDSDNRIQSAATTKSTCAVNTVGDNVCLTALLSEDRAIQEIQFEPKHAELEKTLLSDSIASGFRKYLSELSSNYYPYGSLSHQLLDDLPTGATIASYVHFRQFTHELNFVPDDISNNILSRLTDTCSGWRKNGEAVTALCHNKPIPVKLGNKTKANYFDEDINLFNEPLELYWMKRQRKIQVIQEPDLIRIKAAFHDSISEKLNQETTLQGYQIKIVAELVKNSWIIKDTAVLNYALPFDECQDARYSIKNLIESPLLEIAQRALSLKGTIGCLHLNDLLRAVGFTVKYLQNVFQSF